METHSPLSAMLIENIQFNNSNEVIEYDGFWSSSLTDSTIRGKPDIELIDIAHRLSAVSEIFDVTSKPLIFDADTGGKIEHIIYSISTAERLGISAIIIEDKEGLKKNSLLGNDVYQRQAKPEEFAKKISAAAKAAKTDEFMVIARIESLILDAGMADALFRADLYVEAGAKGIMIHSRKSDPTEIFIFAKKFKESHPTITLVCVPTSFNQVKFDDLISHGYNIVIYANHLLRAAYPAMKYVAEMILKNGRTQEIESNCMSINDILELIPGTK
ncbi:phosphoenolpyruvate phosphomutase [Providencia alcalifaciens]|nr:phosphoenolpyruvate phosphomutase [Providencia alcalifaciens]